MNYPWIKSALAGLIIGIAPITCADAQDTQKYTSFEYADKAQRFKAIFYAKETLGDWTIAKDAPPFKADIGVDVNVTLAFQNKSDPLLYGLIRTLPNLHGKDCGSAFKSAAEADGLDLVKYHVNKIDEHGSAFIFEYHDPKQKIVAVSRAICNQWRGLELFIVAPDMKKYGPIVSELVRDVSIEISNEPVEPEK